jgi:uncharacterized protein (UPF0548 family)
MLLSFTSPGLSKTRNYLFTQSKLSFSYPELTATQSPDPVRNYDHDFAQISLGEGSQTFEKAKVLLKKWKMFPFSWTKILPPNAPIEAGVTVVMYARFLGIWWGLPCRILYLIDKPDQFGFAYGTLPGHIEQGEELFLVKMEPDGTVVYQIKAFSKPRHWLAKLGYPLVRMLQAKFRNDSTLQMQQLVKSSLP